MTFDKVKFNPISPDPTEQAKAKLKCLDALTCVNAFIALYRVSHEDQEELAIKMKELFTLCDNYGLVPKGNVFNQ